VEASSVPVLTTVDAVVAAVEAVDDCVYVRFSQAPPDGSDEPSTDGESGLDLPGYSVNPLDPPRWWPADRIEEWIVRRVCTYAHLQAREPDRQCWLVQGTVVDRGPDNEPLLTDATPIAMVDSEVVAECMRRRVAAGLEDHDAAGPPWQADESRGGE
jgi:hypothetical protein